MERLQVELLSGIAIAVAVFAGGGSFSSPQAFSVPPGCGNPCGVQRLWRKSRQAPEISRMLFTPTDIGSWGPKSTRVRL
jgi:hypothetical protein